MRFPLHPHPLRSAWRSDPAGLIPLLGAAVLLWLAPGIMPLAAQDPEPAEVEVVDAPATPPEPEQGDGAPDEENTENDAPPADFGDRPGRPGAEPASTPSAAPPRPSPSAATPAQPAPPGDKQALAPVQDDRGARRDRSGSRDRRSESRRSGDVSTTDAGTGESVTNAPLDPTNIASFKMIADRNIFDPKRTKRSGTSGPRPPARPDPVVETIGVVGILEGTRGTVAFLDGSSSRYRQAVRVDGEVAGLRVAAITGDMVRVIDGDRTHEVALGSHLRREDGGPWEVRTGTAESGRSAEGRRDSGTAASSSETAAPADAGGGGVSDALKRLLQKRQQEINR